jgi:hypothetical protein
MAKNLCKWGKKDLEKNLDEYTEIVKDPRFVCMKCGRVANKKKLLCKPKELKVG